MEPEPKKRRVERAYGPRKSRFEGKVAIITGAAGNFGSVCARMMAAEGATLALVDLDGPKVNALVGDLRDEYAGVTAKAWAVDVTREEQVRGMVEEVRKDFRGIDCLFNNAGYQGLFAPVDKYSFDDFEKVMKVNVTGVFAVLKYVSQVMVEQGRGSVVNTASCAGLGCPTSMPAYATSKAAVVHLTKVAALDLAPSNVRVNSVSPAFIGPPDGFMWRRQIELQATANPTGAPEFYFSDDPKRVEEQMLESVPLRRLGTPEDVINSVLFLLSEESAYTTGTDLNVSGGNVLGGCRG